MIANWTFFLLFFHSKIVELEEELRVVGNNLKSLEVSEEKVNSHVIQFLDNLEDDNYFKNSLPNFPPSIIFTFVSIAYHYN